jgi:hypothetical protein
LNWFTSHAEIATIAQNQSNVEKEEEIDPSKAMQRPA